MTDRHRWAVAWLCLITQIWGCDSPDSDNRSDTDAVVTKDTFVGEENPVRSEDWFEDWTPLSQVQFQYSTGREAECRTILETVGGGLGIVDFDLDRRPDLFCVGGGTLDRRTSVPRGSRCGLFRNLDGSHFRDVTGLSHLPAHTDYSHGCVSADWNSDGFPDLFITCYGQNQLLTNLGDGTFVEDAEDAGLNGPPTWNTAAAFGDVNQDGELDLFVTGYVDWIPSPAQNSDVPPPQAFNPIPDHLYLNSGDGRLIEVSDQAGIRRDGMGLGVIAADVNDDQRIDFYVANDVVENHLYLGTDQLPLREAGALNGVAFNESGSPEGSMGVDCADVNGDGRADLWVTNYEMEDNSLYLNLGNGQFQHATMALGLAGIGRPLVKFGTGLRDFDGDGWLDLFFVNGHVRYQPQWGTFLQLPVLCRNNHGTGFVDMTQAGGPWFRSVHSARGTATGDLDGDGGLDLMISSLSEPVAVLHNRHPAPNWVRIRLVGTRSPRTPIGSRVSLPAFGRTCVRTITSGSGYLSHSDDVLLLAVEREVSAVDVTVLWPSGLNEVFPQCTARSESVLVEGRGQVAVAVPADSGPMRN